MSGLIVSRTRHVGSISLDRPEVLNSLTLEMARGFSRALDEFVADPEIFAVVVTGEGERAFCAGGDLRALYELRHGDRSAYKTFWREEYELNARVARFPKPYVALMDGIVMGAGVGLSAHGNRRIVTERTRLAMPETGIGFIPDIGGTWLLTSDSGVGLYMALSGETVGAEDAIYAGLADTLVDSAAILELLTLLREIDAAEEIDPLLARFATKPGTGPLTRNDALLREAMSKDTVEEVVASLAAARSDFARTAALTIAKRSPTSLKATFELLKRAAAADRLETCLVNEYRAACSLVETHDLYEGIRAAVIDKDRRPRWSPASLAEVSDERIRALLAGTGDPEPVFGPDDA
jgi:enoyl-CoA hydratase